jgi:acyl-[acyl-carrier-protein]-phospholipid O-acyltransferase/long-chain-fatty-acid--[acyl-carrier-protein] ligase
MLKAVIRWVLARLYRVRLVGLDHLEQAGERVLIVANHTSFLDPALLWAFLPDDVTFAINTQIAQAAWVKPLLPLARVFPMDPTNPMSVKALTRHLQQGHRAVLFPEGRITVTGALMKIYDGAGLIADKAGAMVLPIRIDGAQYTPFSRLRGVVRLRWFPQVTLNLLSPRHLQVPAELNGDQRRNWLGTALEDVMSEMVFATSQYRQTLFGALLDARRVHGGRQVVLEDMGRVPVSYDKLIAQSWALGRLLQAQSEPGERVGLLLANSNAAVAVFFGLQAYGRIPAMLNYTSGAGAMLACARLAGVELIVTSQRFVGLAKLEDDVAMLEQHVRIVYLEELAGALTWSDRLQAFVRSRCMGDESAFSRTPDDPAVILFTSGSEGSPKGVALSHANLLANREQLAAKVDFNAQDRILNAMPLFHSFGLMAGTLLPLLSGMKTFLYPSPLHFRIIPEVAYDTNATILFGTNTFLAGYGRHAHPYDFYSMRYVFAGAEKLQEDTRRLWSDKFGIRLLEGYGATETSPVLSVNTAMHYRAGSVGRLVPGVEHRIEPVPGIAVGGRLHVRGANVMLGYLSPSTPGAIDAPSSTFGAAWYDTGDIVAVDAEGYLWIQGRLKRFAKVAGEMVSLTAVEEIARRIAPDVLHAAVALPDSARGEQIVLVSEAEAIGRSEFARVVRDQGGADLMVPRLFQSLTPLPLLPAGKINYLAVTEAVKTQVAEG